jgi:hypothetical protein
MMISDQRSSKTHDDMSCFIVEVGLFGNIGLRCCFRLLSLESSVSSLWVSIERGVREIYGKAFVDNTLYCKNLVAILIPREYFQRIRDKHRFSEKSTVFWG